MTHLFLFILCHTMVTSVSAYRSFSRDNMIRSMLRHGAFNSIERHLAAQSQSQPQVTCSGAACTYAFTVSANNHVIGECNSSNQEINTKIAHLSSKLDQVLNAVETKNEIKVETMEKQMSILKRQLQTERIQRNKLEKQLRGQTRAIHRYRQVCRKNETYPPAIRDCQDVYEYITRKHGVFEIQPKNGPKMSVFCEDGWTVFQSREDGSVTFDRDWEEYKHGFGKPSAEYWLGNENIHYISRQKSYKLMVELGDWEGRSANAIYDSFKIENEQGFYRLHLGKFVTGAARDGLRFHENIAHGGSVNGMAFSTRDRDHDKSSRNCAKLYNGGWWYNDCFWSNLNGDYVYKGGVFSDKFTWFPWKMNHYSLKTSKMKLKPT